MTVEEFLKEKGLDVDNFVIHDISDGGYLPQIPISKWLIEFAKYHVQKALKEASKSIELTKLDWEDFYDFIKGVSTGYNTENIQAILEAYPLENIK